jgi:AcrR family transcriptional regulator
VGGIALQRSEIGLKNSSFKNRNVGYDRLLFQKLVNYIRPMDIRGGAALAAPSAEKGVLKKLKPGPGLSRQAVATDQKLRLRVALVALVAEFGFAAVTVRALIRRAGVSTSTFYNHFDSVEGCLAGIVVMTLQILIGDMEEASRHGVDLLDGMQSGLRHLLGHLSREPELAQVVFIEAYAAGPQVREEMEASLETLEALVAEALTLAPRPVTGTTHLAAGLVAGIVGTIRKTARTGKAEELSGLTDDMNDWMFSVAHEEVVAFSQPSSRPSDGEAGGLLFQMRKLEMSPEAVADAGRRAITTAARLAAADGLNGLTSAKIRKDAGLSRREFERHFTGVEDCFLDAVESVANTAARVAGSAAEGVEGWERRTFKTVGTLCSLAAGDGGLSRLVLLDVTAPGRAGLLRRDALIERAAERICDQAPPDRRPSDLATIASVEAIWRIAETEVMAGRTKELRRLAPVFVYMILAPRRLSLRALSKLLPEVGFSGGETLPPELATAAA